MARIALVALALLTALPAQAPAPAAETARTLNAVWTADEAMLWWWLQDAATSLRQKKAKPFAPLRTASPDELAPGFRACLFTDGPEGWTQADAQPGGDARWAVYFWPTDDASRFAFCLASDGRLLASANTTGYLGQSRVPEPTAATGAGGKGRFADLLTMPGKGSDGDLWHTPETLRSTSFEVLLLDEQGAPWRDGEVCLLPAAWLPGNRNVLQVKGTAPFPQPLPAGMVRLDAEGRGTLCGPVARDLVLCGGSREAMATLVPDQVRREGEQLVLTVSRRQVASARANANESAAIATLKNIASAQAQCQASGVVDVNQNGAGEYGCFAELTGEVGVRGPDAVLTDQKITPPVLSRAFSKHTDGVVIRSGYCFRIFLPGKGGAPVSEHTDGTGMKGIAVDPARAEVLWCCYAWPIEAGVTGQRAFFVNQAGDVLAAPNAGNAYSGKDKPPAAPAAFGPGEGHLERPPTANQTGTDGQRWTVIG